MTTVEERLDLDPASLHGSLTDPVIGSIGFLNEVMTRYPDAISFAPGAPHPAAIRDIDPAALTERFLVHLTHARGLDWPTARRMLYEYGPGRGLINDLVAEALARDEGIDTDPASIVITVGAQEAMLLALRALFGSPGDVLAVADPCFAGIVGAARLLDVPVVAVPDGMAGLDVAALERACVTARRAGTRIRACYLAPDFANPGGGRMPVEQRLRLLDLAEREDLYLLEDNAYGFTAATTDVRPGLKALDQGRRVVHIGTFAKVCFPGARVGYVLADQRTGPGRRLADDLADLKTMVTVNTSPLCQAVVGGLLLTHGTSLAALAAGKAERYRRNLACLLSELDRQVGVDLPGVRWNRPDGGFFVRVDLPVPADAALLAVSAAEYGVLWTPMSQFHLGPEGDRQLRLSCSYLDPGRIETGVGRLAAFLRKEIAA